MANYARGIKGQYIIVIPEYEMTLSRLGKKRGEKDEHNQPVDIYDYLDFAESIHIQALGMADDSISHTGADTSYSSSIVIEEK